LDTWANTASRLLASKASAARSAPALDRPPPNRGSAIPAPRAGTRSPSRADQSGFTTPVPAAREEGAGHAEALFDQRMKAGQQPITAAYGEIVGGRHGLSRDAAPGGWAPGDRFIVDADDSITRPPTEQLRSNSD
jgi:hypothetical protein